MEYPDVAPCFSWDNVLHTQLVYVGLYSTLPKKRVLRNEEAVGCHVIHNNNKHRVRDGSKVERYSKRCIVWILKTLLLRTSAGYLFLFSVESYT